MDNPKPTDTFAALCNMIEELLQVESKSINELSRETTQRVLHSSIQHQTTFNQLVQGMQDHQEELLLQREKMRLLHDELSLLKQQYSLLYDTAPIGYVTINESDIVIAANPAMSLLLNNQQAAIFHKPFIQFVVERDQDIYALHRQRLLITGEPQSCEVRLQRHDGSTLAVRLESRADYISKASSARFLTAVIDLSLTHSNRALQYEIAERKRAEEAENRARKAAERAMTQAERLQEITEALADAVSSIQATEVIINQGLPACGAYGGFVAFVRSDDDMTLDVAYSKGYASGAFKLGSTIAPNALLPVRDAIQSNQPIWISSRAACQSNYPAQTSIDQASAAWAALPLETGDRVLGALGLSFAEEQSFGSEERTFLLTLARQYTQALERIRLYEAEQQARAAAEEAVQVRDHVFRLITHDLKAPLTAIQGHTQLLLRRVASGNPIETGYLKTNLSSIEEGTIQMVSQIQELLDVVCIQGGQPLSLKCKPLDLAVLVKNVVDTYQQMSNDHHIHNNIVSISLMSVGDELRLKRVLGNLITNATKYSPEGGEVVVSVTRQQNEDTEWGIISVRDHGIGIPSSDLPSIFDPFQRASNVNGRFPGTGLGLASARQIVEQHGGTVTVDSEEGTGSVFTIRLPLGETMPGNDEGE
jgi:signal transduction histidine kinase/PAS domain-containing protein